MVSVDMLERLVSCFERSPSHLQFAIPKWNYFNYKQQELYVEDMRWLISALRNHIRSESNLDVDILMRIKKAHEELSNMDLSFLEINLNELLSAEEINEAIALKQGN